MKNKPVKHPCLGCVYFDTCGEKTRTKLCKGRKTRREQRMNWRELYNNIPAFKEYVDKFSAHNGISVATALTHAMVHQYYYDLNPVEVKNG